MAIYNYKKFKISLRPDTKKTQGLRTGDIVRRQYFDGKNTIYSLMCVLSYGTEEVIDESTNEVVERQYFIGALLEGDVPKTEELLDFARITNLFDTNRLGALYLTGSDDQAPFMDVIDGIGKNESLSWPVNIATADYADSESQYVFQGGDAIDIEYIPSIGEHYRVAHIKRNNVEATNTICLQQDFYKYIANPKRVLVSYKIRASQDLNCKIKLGYQDGTRGDGEDEVAITTEWQYKFHAITVEYSGRYLRQFTMNFDNLVENDEVWIADFNIILLSSITNFADASKMRMGKLTGITDPVFGQLDGYGGYMQKLFASQSAHISGTLTAGDENGFAATFYAGKIHRNTFVNSLDIDFVSAITISQAVESPTGMGNVYSSSGTMIMNAQSASWRIEQTGAEYTFSFWSHHKEACQVSVLQNNKVVGTIQIQEVDALSWNRHKVTFEIQESDDASESLTISIVPSYASDVQDTEWYFSSPQLEFGSIVTQYQPTDSELNYTDEYGAWFNRGGIGGTIQNPLLKLNYDDEGGIGTRTKSMLLKADGSGYFANQNIKWNKEGDVTFGENVTMGWNNLTNEVKENIVSKSIKIVGTDIFTLLGDLSGADPTTSPSSILLNIEEENLQSTSSQRKWYYQSGYDWVLFEGENSKTLTIFPFADYWGSDNSLTVKCEVVYNGETYTDTFTVKKQYIQGYTIEISSSGGTAFKNYTCSTTLTANVFYQGKLVDPDYADKNYTFKWHKYNATDLENEVANWSDGLDITQREIEVNYEISGQDIYVCELVLAAGFPYEFPLIF